MTQQPFLDRYRAPGVFTGLEGFEDQIDALPAQVGAVAAFVHGLLIHEGLAGAYGVTLAAGRGDGRACGCAGITLPPRSPRPAAARG